MLLGRDEDEFADEALLGKILLRPRNVGAHLGHETVFGQAAVLQGAEVKIGIEGAVRPFENIGVARFLNDRIAARRQSEAAARFIERGARDVRGFTDAADRVRATANALVAAHGGTVERVYGTALNGFAARLTPAQAKAFAADARVRYVEPDAVMRTQPNK